MNYPWQYDETIQVGTDYRDANEVHDYDQRMHKLRNIGSEANEIQNALKLSLNSTVWVIRTGTGEYALAIASKTKRDSCQSMYAKNECR